MNAYEFVWLSHVPSPTGSGQVGRHDQGDPPEDCARYQARCVARRLDATVHTYAYMYTHVCIHMHTCIHMYVYHFRVS